MGEVCRLVYGVVFVAVAGVFFLALHLYLAPLLYLYELRLRACTLLATTPVMHLYIAS